MRHNGTFLIIIGCILLVIGSLWIYLATSVDIAAEEPASSLYCNYFIIDEILAGNSVFFTGFVHDPNTGVKYFVNDYHQQGGITPIYNADGTLQIWTE